MRFSSVEFIVAGLIMLAGMVSSCGLEQEIEIDLPTYTPQPVIEGYLTPGRRFGMLITQSSGYFDTLNFDDQQFIENALIADAEVRITYGSEEVVLANQPAFDPVLGQLYNYTSRRIIPANYQDSFKLSITFSDGTMAYGTTKILPPVPIDSSVVEFPEDVSTQDTIRGRILTYITDPDPTQINRFRKLLTTNPATGEPEQDFVYTDETSDQLSIVTGTGFDFEVGDTIFTFSTHVDAEFEDYTNSVQIAVASNGNPFAQPSSILTNLSGSAQPIGIFTGYPFVADTVVIPQP